MNGGEITNGDLLNQFTETVKAKLLAYDGDGTPNIPSMITSFLNAKQGEEDAGLRLFFELAKKQYKANLYTKEFAYHTQVAAPRCFRGSIGYEDNQVHENGFDSCLVFGVNACCGMRMYNTVMDFANIQSAAPGNSWRSVLEQLSL